MKKITLLLSLVSVGSYAMVDASMFVQPLAKKNDIVTPQFEIKKKGMFQKNRIPFNEKEILNLAYTKALQLINQGNEVKASKLLQKVLDKVPNYTKARIKLFDIYRNIGWDSEALNLVNEGLTLDKSNHALLEQKATILLEDNDAEQALSLLLRVPYHKRKEVRYNSLLAMSYFKLELFDLAYKNYNELIKKEMSNSKWWLGYALSLDSLGKNKEAKRGFQRVKSLGGINKDVLVYVNNRLAQLTE